MKKKKKWIKGRHLLTRNLVSLALFPYTRWKFGVKAERFKEQGDRAYLILMNHQTGFDQFFVSMSFKGAVYFVATEDIFSKGFVSSIIRFLVAPIPIKKQTTDATAVINCMRVAKEGGTIAMAPEGNRTYSGSTEYISPSIVPLAKRMKLPIALYRIEGGYGVQPRWSDGIRKGKMRAFVSRVIEPEEYAVLSDDELYELIKTELYVDENAETGIYKSKKRAEFLDRAIYVCPFCGLAKHFAAGNEISCTKCGKTVEYGEDKKLRGKGFDFPFEYAGQWYKHQNCYVNSFDLTKHKEKPLFTDTATILEVVVNKNKKLIYKNAPVSLYGDRAVVNEGGAHELCLSFDKATAASALGRNKCNLYHEGKVYQFKGDKHFNALKYVNFYYRYNNIVKGETNGQFLGL